MFYIMYMDLAKLITTKRVISLARPIALTCTF